MKEVKHWPHPGLTHRQITTVQTAHRHKMAAPVTVQWQEAGGSGDNLISLRFPA